MFLNYIIFMLFVHLFMNYVIFTLQNVKFNLTFCSVQHFVVYKISE